MNELSLAHQPSLFCVLPEGICPSDESVKALGRTCLVCGDGFTPTRSWQKCCSQKCTNKAKWRRSQLAHPGRTTEWEKANREKSRASKRAYYTANRERLQAKSRKWTAENRNKVRAIRAKSKRKSLVFWKGSAYDKLGSKCATCGELRWPVLTIDHVNGDGAEHRRQSKRNQKIFYREVVIDSSGRFQLLCMNCQWWKRFEKKEFQQPQHFPEIKSPAEISQGGVDYQI